jgi:hypothetical protein
VVQIGRSTTRESGCDLASGAKYTQDTIHRVMRTRSGKALQAVAPASGIIPEDRPIKWVWGNCKKGKSKERLEAYRCTTTYADAISYGMKSADFEFDVMHGICAVEGFRLPRTAVKAGLQGTCFVCLCTFKTNPRGRMFMCRHQACYDCEADARVTHMRCTCGKAVVRSA